MINKKEWPEVCKKKMQKALWMCRVIYKVFSQIGLHLPTLVDIG